MKFDHIKASNEVLTDLEDKKFAHMVKIEYNKLRNKYKKAKLIKTRYNRIFLSLLKWITQGNVCIKQMNHFNKIVWLNNKSDNREIITFHYSKIHLRHYEINNQNS